MLEKTNTLAEKMLHAYEDNPVIRALVQLAIAPFPYGVGSAVDSALTKGIQNIREKRARAYFDELAAGARVLTEDVIEREEFLHAYFCTLTAAGRSSKSEKARLFAELLLGGVKAGRLGTDEFDEYYGILEDLSVREWEVLLLLHRFETSHPNQLRAGGEIENDLQRCSRFWDSYEAAVESECGVSRDLLRPMLTRLNRTGLYETFYRCIPWL